MNSMSETSFCNFRQRANKGKFILHDLVGMQKIFTDEEY